jgi:hypothetical protein
MLILPENIGIVTSGFYMTGGSDNKCVIYMKKIKDVTIIHPDIRKQVGDFVINKS